MAVAWILAALFALPAFFIENDTVRVIILTICACIAILGPMMENSNKKE
jgi:hypothetical protein